MPALRELDATASALAFFGAELRHYRLKAGLTLEQLAEKVNYSVSMLGSVELARRAPSKDLAERCDEVLNTGGALMRLWPLARKAAFPTWFRQWIDIEQTALSLKTWQPLIVPGLLQTADYARAIISQRPDLTAEDVEERVTARLARQEIFDQKKPPMFWVVLDEGVLYRQVGEPEVMRDQLQALIKFGKQTKSTIQIVPSDAQALLGLTGAFIIATLPGDPTCVYLDTAATGYITDQEKDVETIATRYEMIRSLALSAPASLELIEKVMEERWTLT